MPNSFKDIIIIPNRNSANFDPNIAFRGGNATANTEIMLRVYPDANGTLSWEGSAGQLFSISNDLTGTIFSVNDISGIPSIEAYANGVVSLAQYSGNVGIGTTSPIGKLNVVGTANITGALTVTGNITAGNLLATSLVNGNSNIIVNANGNITMAASGSERLRITTTGNVGIGISTPNAVLDVNRGSRTGVHLAAPTFYVTGDMSTGQTGGASNNIEFRHINGTQGIGFGYNTIYQAGTNTNEILNLLSKGTSPLTLNAYPYATGNVGINTTNPIAKLHINAGSVQSANAAVRIQAADQVSLDLISDNSTSTNRNWRISGVYNSYGTFEILSSTTAGGSPTTSRLAINSSGNVGIGITAPTARLQIVGSGVDAAGAYIGLGSSNYLDAQYNVFRLANQTETMRIDNVGNVGIGTSGPNALFEVSRATTDAVLLAEVARISTTGRSSANGTNNRGTLLAFYDAMNPTLTSSLGGIRESPSGNYNGGLAIYTNDTGATPATSVSQLTERMRVTSTGNVGIGTSTPDTRLNVAVSNPTRGIISTFTNTASSGQNGAQIVLFQSGVTAWSLGMPGAVADFAIYSGRSVTNDGTERVRITSSGNVGIGTNTPRGSLEVAAAASSSQVVFPYAMVIGRGGTGYGTIGYNTDYRDATNNTSNVKYLVTDTISQVDFSSQEFIFRRAPSGTSGTVASLTEVMRIASSGNVGISTSTPRARLDVGGTTANSIQAILARFPGDNLFALAALNGNTTTNVSGSETARFGVIYDTNFSSFSAGFSFIRGGGAVDGAMTMITNATERIRITSTGNVGIGTTTPQYELDVNSGTGNVFALSAGTNFNAGLWSGIHFGYSEAASTLYRKSAIVFERQDSAARGKIHLLNNGDNNSNSATLADSKVTIQFDGNVGIGTTSPNQKLVVNGAAAVGPGNKLSFVGLDINSGSTDGNIKIKTTIPFVLASADFTVNIKGFVYGESAMADLSVGWHYYLGNFYNPAVKSSGGWAPTVTLSNEANLVCINLTSAPVYWQKLYVESMYSSTYNSQYASGWSWAHETANSANIATCTYKSAFSPTFVSTSAGNVGIGTASPGSALHLNNASAAGATPRIRFTNTTTGTGATDGSYVGISNNNELDIYNYESANVRIGTFDNVRVIINSTGNLGIAGAGFAISDPQATLDIGGQGSNFIQAAFNRSPSNTSTRLSVINGNTAVDAIGSELVRIGTLFSANVSNIGAGIAFYRGATPTEGSLSLLTGVNRRLTVSNTGNVGINTINPVGTLNVVGTANVTGNLTVSGDAVFGDTSGGNISNVNYVTANFYIGDGGLLSNISGASSGNSISAGNSNVRVDTSGNVRVSVTGVPNVGVFTSGGLVITGTLNATANANTGNIGATNAVFTTVAGTLTTAAQPNITSVGTLTSGNVANLTGSNGLFVQAGQATQFNYSKFVNNLGGNSGLVILTLGSTYASGSLWNVGANGVTLYSSANAPMAIGTELQQPLRLGANSQTQLQLYANGLIQANGIATFSSNVTISGNLAVSANAVFANGSGGSLIGANSVTANFFIGDGGLLSNISAVAGSQLVNGNSNVVVSANANITMSTTGSERVRILTTGNVGVNTTTPAQRFVVNGGIQTIGSATLSAAMAPGILSFETPNLRMYIGDGTGYTMAFSKRSGSVTTDLVTITDAGSGNMNVLGTVTCNNLVETSTIAVKNNVAPITNALDTVGQLLGVTYDRKDGSKRGEAGLIAEHVAQILPNLIGYDESGKPVGIHYTKLTAYLIEAVKELSDRIKRLENKK